MRFESVNDVQRIAEFLRPTPVLGAYPLSYLDPDYASYGTWFEAVDEHSSTRAVLLVYRGLSLPVVMTVGDNDAAGELLRDCRTHLPSQFYAQLPQGHAAGLLRGYRADLLRKMVRMAVTADSFQAPEPREDEVVQVRHTDMADLMDLYRHYPDAFFEPYQLESGFYFGVRHHGRLVSVAGVHSVSVQYDVGVIGNVVTHPEYRNQGLSTLCTGHLLRALFDKVGLVALNVEVDNPAARRSYEKLGFAERAQFVEGLVERR